MRAIRAARAVTCIALASALCVPAFAAAFDYYLKLPPIEGDSSSGKGHKQEIEILSWSWGSSQPGTGAHGAGGGHGAGKVNVHDISLAPAPQAGEAEITLKGDPAGARKRPGRVKYGDITLKRGTMAEAEAGGGVSVAAGDLDGDGRAERKSTPKLAESVATGKHLEPPRGTPGTLTTLVPAGACRLGARYPTAEMGVGGRVFRLEGLVVAACSPAAAGGDRPMESISLNYTKVEF